MSKLTDDEIKLYDRQIRLWGLSSQQKLLQSKVLIINLNSTGMEITKNLILSGMGNLTIWDNFKVQLNNVGTHFNLTENDVGEFRIDASKDYFNDLKNSSFINVNFDTINWDQLDENKLIENMSGFDLIIGNQLTSEQSIKLNNLTRSLNIPSYITANNGLFSFIFVDLIKMNATKEKTIRVKYDTKLKKIIDINPLESQLIELSKNRKIVNVEAKIDTSESIVSTDTTIVDAKWVETVTIENNFKPLKDILSDISSITCNWNKRQFKRYNPILPLSLAQLKYSMDSSGAINKTEFENELTKICLDMKLDYEKIKNEYREQFVNQWGLDFLPVASVIGGAVAQDIINYLTKKLDPLNNFIVLDGLTLDMSIFEL